MNEGKSLSFFTSLFEQKEPFVIDVRSPKEFANGHIPYAINIPLFSDEQRAIVGTTYKQQGKRAAIEIGLSLISLPSFVEKIKELGVPHKVTIYCARGGMRSQAMGWLFNLLGYEVTVVPGGYKAFRQFIIQQFQRPYSLYILAGKTGVGKTECLQKLKNKSFSILDLEDLANHRGSVFGGFDRSQPSQEHFENMLGLHLFSLQDKPFWVEDESRFVGTLRLPDPFFDQMQKASVFILSASLEERIDRIVRDYSTKNVDELIKNIQVLKKNLGQVDMQKTITSLLEKNYTSVCQILLQHYDKKYEKALSKRDPKTLHWIEKKDLENNTIPFFQ